MGKRADVPRSVIVDTPVWIGGRPGVGAAFFTLLVDGAALYALGMSTARRVGCDLKLAWTSARIALDGVVFERFVPTADGEALLLW